MATIYDTYDGFTSWWLSYIQGQTFKIEIFHGT